MFYKLNPKGYRGLINYGLINEFKIPSRYKFNLRLISDI